MNIIKEKTDYDQLRLTEKKNIQINSRKDMRRLRTFLHERVKKQKSVTKKE